MIPLSVTPEAIARAETLAAELGQLRDSIRGGRGNAMGFLAEILAANWLEASHSNTYDHDLVLPDGRTVDVKTKRTNVVPRPWHSASIAHASRRQSCDLYLFCRVHYLGATPVTCYVMGWIAPADYYASAQFLRACDVDPDNGFVVRADCWNLTYERLSNPLELVR